MNRVVKRIGNHVVLIINQTIKEDIRQQMKNQHLFIVVKNINYIHVVHYAQML